MDQACPERRRRVSGGGGVASLASFAGWLVAGTMNLETGYEVWKLAGLNGKSEPIKIISDGGPSSTNEVAGTLMVFQGQLYIGGMLNPMSNIFSGFRAADLIRIDANDNWETVVGPDSISGYGPGFDHWPNTYFWSMAMNGETWSSFDVWNRMVRRPLSPDGRSMT